MKLRILLPKINADFLRQAKAAINVELSRVPIAITYEEALSTFRNAVNQKFPPLVGSSNNRIRRINEVGHQGGRGRGGRSGRGGRGRGGRYSPYGGRGGRGGRNQSGRKKSRPDSWWAVGNESGKVIECHPKISYPNNVWYDIPQQDRERIRDMRSAEKNRTSSASVISEVSSGTTVINGQQYSLVPIPSQQFQIQQLSSNADLPPPPSNIPPPPPPATHVTIMGGRNEQSGLRTRNQNGPSISGVNTGQRRIASARKQVNSPAPGTQGKIECDTNAGTCVLGRNFIVLSYTSRTADVYPYDKSYSPIANVPIVTGATAWDDHVDGQTYILIFNESLYYGERLDHSLVNPNQVRANGIGLWDNPYDPNHNLEIEVYNNIVIPLKI